jgi:hypothetical protein
MRSLRFRTRGIFTLPRMPKIPPLPNEVLARVIITARRNGLSIVIVASLAALTKAAGREVLPAIAAVLAAGTGAMEMHAAGLLHNGMKRGLDWAIRAEMLLLLVILLYCGLRVAHPDLGPAREAFHLSLEMPFMKQQWAKMQQLGVTETEYVSLMYHLTYLVLAPLSLIYQGGMMVYYARRRRGVNAALSGE